MRDVDPDTQCEIIPDRRSRLPGRLSAIMAFYSGIMGGYGFPSPKVRARKDELYYVKLTKTEQKLPYETKMELKQLKLSLETMHKRTELQKVYLYKLR